PVSGLLNDDFLIGLTGSAIASDVTETEFDGVYTFSVTNTVEESVTVTITADGIQLTVQPQIIFNAPAQVVDAANSDADTTSPHIADGIDKSLVTIKLLDTADEPVSGLLNDDFLIVLTGSAIASDVTETEFDGVYTFSVTNTVEESVTVTITAVGTELTQKPVILFENEPSPPPPPTVSASNSSVTATSPHLADGSDASTVTIILRDESNEPIPGFTNDDFLIDLEGIGEATNAESTDVTETSTPGTYHFQVTNVSEDIVTVYVRADFVDLSDTPEIVFEEAATAGESFVTLWNTSDGQILIPVQTSGLTYNYDIYWELPDLVSGTITGVNGDGVINVPEPGVYRVEITGTFPRIQLGRFNVSQAHRDKLISIEQWGDIEWESMAFAFYGATNLEISATDAPDLRNVTSLEAMFGEALKVNSDLNHWDVSNIGTMRRMFQGKFDEPSAFNGNISNWNVGNVTDMQQMFQHATSFNRDISGWDVDKVENMAMMFERAESFNQNIGYNPVTETGWDVSSVTNMGGMFFGATAFNRDIGGWDVSSVKNFGEADGFPAGGMFEDAVNFNQDLSNWDITAITGDFGEDMFQMFDRSGLSKENYDALLIEWADRIDANGGEPTGINLGADGLTYCAVDAREKLVDAYGWDIDGDEQAADCSDSFAPFVTTWKTNNSGDSEDNQIRIPLYGDGYNITVDWGDGSSASYTPMPSGIDPRHYIEYTYSEPGTYTVSISGDFPQIYFNQRGDTEKILSIEQWGDIQWRSMEMAFAGASNLVVNAPDAPNFSNVDNLRRMFLGASSLNSDLNHWDVSTITSMEEMFWNAGSFNGDISDWNVSSVEFMGGMFRGATSFNQDLNSWNVSNVTRMNGMFLDATSFNGDISGWNTENVTTMSAMFQRARSFNGEIGGWNTEKVTTMASMFRDAEDFNADIGSWNVSSVTTMESMFQGASVFNQNLRDWGVSNVTMMRSMFEAAISFNGDISDWNTGKVVNMNAMFRGASAFDSDLTGWDVSSVTNMGTMFGGATTFNQDISNWDVSNVTIMSSMFSNATTFNQNLDYNSDTEEGWNTGKVVNMSSMFSSAIAFNGNLSGWDVSSVINMSGMFALATSFNSDISYWDVSNVTNMSRMFDGAAVFNQPVGSSWNVSKVTNMSRLFLNAAAFDQSLGGWNIESVTTMSFMLANTGLSRKNYDATLIGWSEKEPRLNVAFGAAGRTYCAVDARNILTDTYNWTITGDEPAEDCTEPVQIVDAENSSVSATSPHIADGVDTSVATVTVHDEDDEPITGLTNDDFLVELTGSATATDVEETGTPGTYTFTIANTEIETVTLKVTVQGIELDEQPEIIFEAAVQIVDADASSTSATSPHFSDGVDASVVTIEVVDTEGEPISGLNPGDFTLSHGAVGVLTTISETDVPGTYTFTVTSDKPGIAEIKINVSGTALEDVIITFIKPVDPRESIVNATSPHVADGEDTSTVTITVANEDRELFTGLQSDDFLIELTGSAVVSDVSETATGGFYTFMVTNTVAENVAVTVSVLGVELEVKPEILFEQPIQVPDAENSTVSASSPQIMDDVKTSTVTILLRDENDQPIPGRTNDDFNIQVKGSAVFSSITETDTPGTYRFTVTNKEEEIVIVAVTAEGIELNDQPEIDFISPPKVPDASLSKVAATTPHLADGEDASEVLISLVDEDRKPIIGFMNDDFVIELTGSAVASAVSETAAEGVYTFMVTNTIAENVTITVKAGGVELDIQPEVEFEAPPQIVNTEHSSVTATSPHLADGEDMSVVTILLRDQNDTPITGFSHADFKVILSGSAKASEVTETDTEGTYTFSVINNEAEVVTVTVSVDGIELNDQPEIDFESPPQVVDAHLSIISATTPHIANGMDASEVNVFLWDEHDDVISGFTADDFEVTLSGNATASPVTETDKPGTYLFEVTSTETGTVTVAVTAGGVNINRRAFIVFEEPEIVVDVNGSAVSATSPHLADGEDFSTISIKLRDNKSEPISGLLAEDFDFELPDGVTASKINETNTKGIYELTVVSIRPGVINLKFLVLGFPLTQIAEIEFTEPEPVVDTANSKVTATSPHLADGEDSSTVTITLIDEEDELITGVSPDHFSIKINGIASASEPVESDSGVYRFTVVSEFVGSVILRITVFGVELNDIALIEFEAVPVLVPDPPVITDLTGDASEVKITWQPMNFDFIQNFIIYRGESPDNLMQIGQAAANKTSYVDGAPSGNTLFYRLSALNTDGVEGGLSEVATFFNSSIIADQTEWRLVSSPLVTPLPGHENITLFGFSNQYELSDQLMPSAGYWIKSRTFDPETVPVTGSGLTSSTYNLKEGWNLIGSLSAPATVSNIADESGILTQAPVFGFSPTGYTAVQTLLPNNGYWIYASGEGVINLKMDDQTEQNKQVALKEAVNFNETKSWIEFQQAGQKRKIWMSDYPVSNDEKMSYILPPLPPGDLLDVRTSGSLNLVDSHSEWIHIRSNEFPVTVSLHGLDEYSAYTWRFRMSNGNDEYTADILPGKPIQLLREYDRIEMMRIRMDEAITENRLLPNYPNPFNPATTISYQIRNHGFVRVEVFDSIGRRVQVLTNEIQTSGEYKVNFDATHLSTGMYIVRFMAGGESQIRKITLIK
ncbi:MAG: BspA family leucine-rich repeat surface protein, partial [Balneolaceae bacterium]|nr:BspA family leucine-rich repeat surface protein [Balneolaceae bacterium]